MRTSIKILYIAGFILLCTLVGLAILPSCLSTSYGTKILLKIINTQIEGKLTLEKIKMSWLSDQRIENLKWVDRCDNVVLQIPHLESDTPLIRLAFGRLSLGRTFIDHPFFNLSPEITEKIQKDDEKASKKKREITQWRYPQFEDGLFVHNGTIIFNSSQISPITISQIEVEKKSRTDCFHLKAETAQGSQRGSIAIHATCTQKIEVKVNLLDFPIASLDELQGSTLLTDALGPTLNAQLDFEKDERSSLFVHGTLKSANLTAYIEGTTHNQQFSLSPKTHLEFIISPAFFKSLINEEERQNWELATKTEMKVDVEKALFPLVLKQLNFKEILLQAKMTIDRAELHHRDLGSYSLKGFSASISSQNNLEIAYSGEILGKEHTKLTGTISMTPQKEFLFQYQYEGFPVSLISLFSPHLEKNVRALFGNHFNMENQGNYRQGHLESLFSIVSPMTQLKGKLNGTLPHLDFEIKGISQVPYLKAKYLGQEIGFNLTGKFDLTAGQLFIPLLKGEVANDHFTFDFRGKVGEKGEPFTPASIHLLGSGVLKNLPLLEEKGEAVLKNATSSLKVDGSKNQALLKIDGLGFEAHLEVHHFIQKSSIDFDQAEMDFSLECRDFSTNAISLLLSENLEPFIGSRINLNAEGKYTPSQEPGFLIDIDVEGEGFAALLAFSLDGTFAIKKTHPSYIHWDISPERYQNLMRQLRLDPQAEPTFTLTRTTKLQIDITELSCPTTPSKDLSHFLCQSGFIGNIHLGTANFKSKWSPDSISFQGIHGSIQGENFSKGINLSLQGNILAANIPETEKSSFSFEGQMLNFWTPEKHFNREGLTVKGALTLDLIPVRQMTGIFPLDPETRSIVQAVLGELMNAHICGEISQLAGPLSVEIKASNFKAILPLQLQRTLIHLRDYVDAEITLTQAVNETLLKDINPLFISGAYSEHPLKLRIDPQGFSIPIRPYSFQGLRIERASLDIGRIRVRNGGQVQYLVDFLQAKEISHDGLMEAWFTPIYFSLQNGIASYNRFDALLANSIHIAMWGNINLITNQVEMTLGIAPSTIAQRFKISGLSKQNMFQVKMSGTTNKLDLDWSAASKRITFLVAKSAVGGLGMLIGGLLEPLINANLGEEKVPPPTTSPLPWESLYPSDPSQIPPKETPRKGGKGLRRLTEFLTS